MMMLRRISFICAALVATVAVACDTVPLTAPTGSTVTVSSANSFVQLGGTTEITAFVVESAGTAVQNGTTVHFSTNLGRVDPVDAQTRNVLEDLVLNVWQEWNKTIIFVTHDIDEAVYLSDRIVVLSGSPASTIADLEVPISRPRDQLLSKQDPRFGEIRAELYELIMGAHKVDREAS